MQTKKGSPSYFLSRISPDPRFDPAEGKSVHVFYPFRELVPGLGFAIQTYSGDAGPGEALPRFTADPYAVPIGETIDEIAATYWAALNEANRVALVVKTIDTAKTDANGHNIVDIKIINQLVPA